MSEHAVKAELQKLNAQQHEMLGILGTMNERLLLIERAMTADVPESPLYDAMEKLTVQVGALAASLQVLPDAVAKAVADELHDGNLENGR